MSASRMFIEHLQSNSTALLREQESDLDDESIPDFQLSDYLIPIFGYRMA